MDVARELSHSTSSSTTPGGQPAPRASVDGVSHGRDGSRLDPASVVGVVTTISSVLAQLRRARTQLPADGTIGDRLDRAIDELEAVGHQLLTRNDAELGEPVTPRGPKRVSSSSVARPPAAVSGAPDERRFLEWLLGCGEPGEPEPSYQDEVAAGLSRLLGALSTSARPLPPEAARIVGGPEGMTIGDAATEILLAVNDPAGPRCRSYRAAVYFLHDRVGDRFSLDLEVRA